MQFIHQFSEIICKRKSFKLLKKYELHISVTIIHKNQTGMNWTLFKMKVLLIIIVASIFIKITFSKQPPFVWWYFLLNFFQFQYFPNFLFQVRKVHKSRMCWIGKDLHWLEMWCEGSFEIWIAVESELWSKPSSYQILCKKIPELTEILINFLWQINLTVWHKEKTAQNFRQYIKIDKIEYCSVTKNIKNFPWFNDIMVWTETTFPGFIKPCPVSGVSNFTLMMRKLKFK